MTMATTQTIIVTGASSGIGRATSSLLLERGYRVIGLARDFSKFACNAPEFQALEIDLSDLAALPSRLDGIAREQGAPDGVICCAGAGSPIRSSGISTTGWSTGCCQGQSVQPVQAFGNRQGDKGVVPRRPLHDRT